MKIGIDVSSLCGQRTGIGRYTYELISRLIDYQNINWVLYSNKSFDGIDTLFKKNVTIKIHDGSNIPRLIWGQLWLPFQLSNDSLDLFWSPTHRVPLLYPRKIPLVVTIHDLVWKFSPSTMKLLSRALDHFFMPIAVKRAAKIIAVSKSTAVDICDEYPESCHKISTVYLGPTEFSPKSKDVISVVDGLRNIRYFLFVGTIEPRKNLLRLIQAFSLLPGDLVKDVFFVIAGGKGWRTDSIENYCEQLNVSNKVFILSYVSDWELGELYKRALFLAMPSLYEGFGLPIIEAMKYGVPCLTSKVSSMPEIAGNAAVYVDPTSVDSIAVGLSEMLGNADLLSGLKLDATTRGLSFSWDTAAKKTLKILKGLC